MTGGWDLELLSRCPGILYSTISYFSFHKSMMNGDRQPARKPSVSPTPRVDRYRHASHSKPTTPFIHQTPRHLHHTGPHPFPHQPLPHLRQSPRHPLIYPPPSTRPQHFRRRRRPWPEHAIQAHPIRQLPPQMHFPAQHPMPVPFGDGSQGVVGIDVAPVFERGAVIQIRRFEFAGGGSAGSGSGDGIEPGSKPAVEIPVLVVSEDGSVSAGNGGGEGRGRAPCLDDDVRAKG